MKNRFALLCAVLCASSAASADELVGTRLETGAASPKALLEHFKAGAAGMRPVAFSLADALPAAPQDEPPAPPAADPAYIDRFRAIESSLLAWDQAYQQAPSGSDAEAEARQQRQLAFDSAQPMIDDPSSLQAYDSQTIEDFTKDCAQKYQTAAAGSLVEAFYKQFIPIGWKAFAGRSELELTWLGHWRQLIEAADRFEQRYQAAPSGSGEESAAREIRDFAWQRAPVVLEQQLGAVLGSSRYLEALAAEFEAGYQAAASGSQRESFFNRARVIAYDAAYREAANTFFDDRRPDVLSALLQEYDAKAQSAPAGSPAQDYFTKVRDLVRQYLPQP